MRTPQELTAAVAEIERWRSVGQPDADRAARYRDDVETLLEAIVLGWAHVKTARDAIATAEGAARSALGEVACLAARVRELEAENARLRAGR